MTLVSVVVPVYYNAATLRALHRRLSSVAAATSDAYEFIFVDDRSGDDSFAVLRELAATDPRVRAIRLSRNFGSNPALAAGLAYATGDCAAVISADLQDPPELIPQLVDQWRGGAEVVLAARRRRSDPLVSRFFASIFNRLFRQLVFRDFPRHGFDFMLVDRKVVRLLVDLGDRNSYLFGQVLWVGFERRILHYDREERPAGRSRWTAARRIKYFIDAFSAFSYVPLRLASILGFLLAGFGFLYAVLIGVRHLSSSAPVTGYTALAVLVLITSGVQLIILGVIGEYLWRTLEQARQRPLYIVDTIVGTAAAPGTRTDR